MRDRGSGIGDQGQNLAASSVARCAFFGALFLVVGCPGPSSPPNSIVGTVLWNGQPADGKVVELLTLASSGASWASVDRVSGKYLFTTKDGGRYVFSGLKPAHYMVQYLSEAIKDPVGNIIGPNEVASWRTKDVNLGGDGATLPAFDVAYNGLTYPDTDKKQTPSSDAPLPFFWSTHPQARRYRVNLYDTSNGNVVNPNGKSKWACPWTENPTATYTANPGIGNYGWEVEIDAGDAGVGKSRVRSVQF